MSTGLIQLNILIDSNLDAAEFVEKNIWKEIELRGNGKPVSALLRGIKVISFEEQNQAISLGNFINSNKEVL